MTAQSKVLPFRSMGIRQTCASDRWSCGGMKSSVDNYSTYTISACQCWYVYRHKPKWFGQFDGDRYIGKLRWMSLHCDGKQRKYVYRRGYLDGMIINEGSEAASDKKVAEMMKIYGYSQMYISDLRQEFYKSHYPQSIRCAVCKETQAETRRRRSKVEMDLNWGGPGWPSNDGRWASFITARESVTCKCSYVPDWDRIQYCVRTGDGLNYN